MKMCFSNVRTVLFPSSSLQPTDIAITADLPDGNSKFSTFEVDTRNASRPLVRVRVVIDGDEAWSLDVVGRPLTLPPVGNVVGGLGKSLMELLGFKVRPLPLFLVCRCGSNEWVVGEQNRKWF